MRHVLFIFTLLLALPSSAQLNLVPFSTGWSRLSEIRNAGDERLFVVNQFGQIFIVDLDGNKNPVPFLDISSQVNYIGGEMGMLGLAFSPDYEQDGMFYVNYTGAGGHTRISRFRVSAANPDSADAASEEVLLLINQPYANHNGGSLHFGPDGFLYCSLGDGGSGGDPGNRAQNLQVALGKILRIDVSMDSGYAVPPDNPFVNDTSALDLVWAYGLRNPWRISFDAFTGALWIADVGQQKWEEINRQPAGHPGGINYGWRCYEGAVPYDTTGCPPASEIVFPLYSYPHTGPVSGCSVTGGYVYRGAKYQAMFGKYFFTDYCSNEIFSMWDSSGSWVIKLEAALAGQGFGTFGVDVHGDLYVAGSNSGDIYRIESADCAPVAFISTEDTVYACDAPAVLSTPFDSSLAYQWTMGGSALPGATGSTFTATSSGWYTVQVTRDSCYSESPAVYVDRCLKARLPLTFTPNPADDALTFVLPASGAPTGRLRVFDAKGALCLEELIPLQPGVGRYTVSVRALEMGVYTAVVESASQRYTGKFTVLRPGD